VLSVWMALATKRRNEAAVRRPAESPSLLRLEHRALDPPRAGDDGNLEHAHDLVLVHNR
jgi:hypothetical protein